MPVMTWATGLGISMGQERRKYPRIATDQVISFAVLESSDQLGVSKTLKPAKNLIH